MTISLPAGTPAQSATQDPSEPSSAAAPGTVAAWRTRLAGVPAVLDLPTDRIPQDGVFRPATVPVPIPAGAAEVLDAAGARPVDGWLVAFAVLLHRFSGQREFVIASPSGSGAVAHRIGITGSSTFACAVGGVEDPDLEALPPAEFAALLHPRTPQTTAFSAGVDRSASPLPWTGSRLTLLVPDPGGEVRLAYDASVLDESRVIRIGQHLARLVEGIVADPHAAVGGLEMLPAAERARVLGGFNNTAVDHTDHRSFEQRVADVAAAAPDAPALSCRRERTTFGELDAAANRLAGELVARGTASGDLVAVFLDRSIEAVVATLAVMRAGAAVVPLDPADDDEWNAYMLRDCDPVAVVTDEGLSGRLRVGDSRPGLVLVDGDADAIAARPPVRPGVTTAPDALSHVVYTSGSTGLPKGVRATVRSLTNLLNWMPAAHGIDADSSGTWISAPGFAIGRMEWMPFLAAGACVHVADAVVAASPQRTRDWLLARKATHTVLTTSFAHRVCALHWPAKAALRTMVVLGEPVRSWPAGDVPFEVSASYGSTEVAVATSGFDLTTGTRETSEVPLPASGRPAAGRPIANVRIYLLDERGGPVPVGAVGEIHVAGDGVCDGYLNLPAGTAERFVENTLPEEPEDRLFRTGDLGRWRPDGILEVIGRQDAQTWVRGVRIEVERVESAICDLPQIREAVVISSSERGRGELVGYLVPHEPEGFSLDLVETALRQRLPGHEVPELMFVLDALPRLANGKLDRQGLPRPVADSVPVVDEENRFEPFGLTDTQQAYWVGRSDAVELGGVGCHGYWEWEGSGLDVARFRVAWQRVLERHDSLRTVILVDGTQQVLVDPPEYHVPVLDLRHLDDDEADRQAEVLRDQMAHQVLPSDTYPLWDVRLTRMPGGRTRIHLGLDLLIIDAWSYFQVLVPDLVACYEHPEAELPPIGLRFRDYVVQVEGALESTAEYQRARDYWMSRIDDLPPAPGLPANPRPFTGDARFTRREFEMPADRWTVLKDASTARSVTSSGIVVAVFAEVLRAWSTNDRFTINFPLFNRIAAHPDIDRMIGDFTTTSLLAVDETGGRFVDRAQSLQRQLWSDLEHRAFGGVRVMREMASRQGVSSRAAFPIVVTSLLGQPPRAFHTALGDAIFTSTQTPQVTLDFQVSEVDGALRLSWDSVDESFPEGLIADMFGVYTDLLDRIVDDEGTWSGERFSLVPSQQMVARAVANDTAGPEPRILLHDAVARHAAARPTATAVVSGPVRLDYAELDARVNRVGRTLRDAGAKRNTLVAVVMEKGWEQIVAAHGVLASGAAYLPIDAGVPDERLAHLLERGEVELALTTSALHDRLAWPAGVRTFRVDTDLDDVDASPLERVGEPTDLAYVIFTSGSTGLPKGVMVDHRGAANTILDINSRFGIGPDDSCMGVSGLHFDLSVYDVFGMIEAGGTVVLPEPAENPDPERWAELVRAEGVTFWNSVPTLMEILTGYAEGLAQDAPLASLRTVVLAGDWIPVTLPDRLRALAPDVRVIASGGPTESCVWSVINPLGEVDTTLPSIPLGRPMTNQRYHVLDERRAHRPDWVAGEIYIASPFGLAQGYWRDQERTDAQFVAAVGEPRAYASGDMGRYLPDGSIEILGRTDFQVKIQGHRIELGEIEAVLAAHPTVDRAVVVAAGERHVARLVAYVTPAGDAVPEPDELRTHLSGRLPGYMVPSTVVVLDELPLTGNGKVDRKTLTGSADGTVVADDAGGPPEGPVEEVVAEIWCDLLGLSSIGRSEHFFRSGGNSIIATRVVTRIRELFGVELPLRVVFTQPTVAEVAAALIADPDDAEQVLGLCALLAELTEDQLAELAN